MKTPLLAGLAAFATALALWAAPALAQVGPAAQIGQAQAATTERRFEAVYDVIARGMQAGEFTYRFVQNGASYEASAERKITGGLRLLAGSSQDYAYSARGSVADGRLQPAAYRHQGGRRNRVVEATFTGDDIVTIANPRMGMGDPPASQAQKQGAIDQITAIAQMVVARGEVCDRTLKVYMDGRSRFDFVMRPNGRVTIDGPAYRGPALRCRVAFQPIAGFGDPQEPAELTFLFAPTASGLYAPVRIEMPTDDAGIVVLDARRLSVNGTRLR